MDNFRTTIIITLAMIYKAHNKVPCLWTFEDCTKYDVQGWQSDNIDLQQASHLDWSLVHLEYNLHVFLRTEKVKILLNFLLWATWRSSVYLISLVTSSGLKWMIFQKCRFTPTIPWFTTGTTSCLAGWATMRSTRWPLAVRSSSGNRFDWSVAAGVAWSSSRSRPTVST